MEILVLQGQFKIRISIKYTLHTQLTLSMSSSFFSDYGKDTETENIKNTYDYVRLFKMPCYYDLFSLEQFPYKTDLFT